MIDVDSKYANQHITSSLAGAFTIHAHAFDSIAVQWVLR